MSGYKKQQYEARVALAVDYIRRHLDDDFSIDVLSEKAELSKFHFHRLFTAFAGISVGRLVQLLRLRRSSYALVFNKERSISDIAFDAGFENAESFTRAFKKTFAQTPSEFRAEPAWKPWLEKFSLPILGGQHNMQIDIVDFPETKVAVLEYSGDHDLLNNVIGQFVEWRKANGLPPDKSKTFNINYLDDGWPETIRMDLCVETSEEVAPNDLGITDKTIPAGRCAVLRHKGSSDNIEDSVNYLYQQWLPNSGEELRDFPSFFHRVKLFPAQVPEHEQITDIYLPIK